ncbi:X8 domain-containing protein, partial [Mycena epipterygia]
WTETDVLFASPMTEVWSGGLAFSYFPAESTGHQFGMATLSSDNTSATTNADFDNLVAQYAKISFVNSPSASSAGAASPPARPAESADIEVSTTLPPTPNDSACSCLESKLSCQFTPQTSDFTDVLGVLTGVVCGLLPGVKGSCDDIAANGTTGVYGVVGQCDPSTKLSYAFSQYYELSNRAATACSFSGNATINSAASTSTVADAVSSCLPSPSAVFTPTSPSGSSGSSSGSSGSGASGSGTSSGSGAGSTGGAKNGALARLELGALMGALVMVGCVLGGMGWTLSL